MSKCASRRSPKRRRSASAGEVAVRRGCGGCAIPSAWGAWRKRDAPVATTAIRCPPLRPQALECRLAGRTGGSHGGRSRRGACGSSRHQGRSVAAEMDGRVQSRVFRHRSLAHSRSRLTRASGSPPPCDNRAAPGPMPRGSVSAARRCRAQCGAGGVPRADRRRRTGGSSWRNARSSRSRRRPRSRSPASASRSAIGAPA